MSSIFADLVEAQRDGDDEEMSQQAPQEFKASHGGFDRFRKRTGIHSVVRPGEAASSDKKAAEEFLKKFEKLISREGYIPQQVFNCDETGLFWKKMPRRIYTTAEEKKLPGHKPMKDRLTLAFCANASVDLKIKTLLVYHSENPRAFKAQNITKERLSVLYLPSNTTPLLQPMDQQVIANFKKLYTMHLFKRCFEVTKSSQLTLPEFWKWHFDIVQCLKMIDKAWNEVTRHTLKSSWKKLWPAVVAERDFEGFDPSTEDEAIDDPAPGDILRKINVPKVY
ncbi:tigger transposable element-derived protein 1-like [Palaemon carinicauda]|uniref:tigger transposable element-derived protein 1-like n=1 Tax=Palaemon carinicauda TaxID=392227 RepID=UPI0035B599D4